ncbi:hypothetical protein RZ897_014035 [Clostridioides difficile]|uniref:hypothetical protein n=1 Tax=Clostridioides difficile TaxID=1496 RepID=UPI00016C6889|nr:hypothetical protein [Clostridioides difficile]EGT4199926.1 hypothetical protein [Clostridioides difficile]EJX2602134.1 hypothetical protein [Clostridioides difficile]ELX4532587.1 hypothetical protein [Clostridioides difficile]EQG38360.1 hypothetical protein QIO_0560 [Clostridioides difficile DA00129]MBH6852886.1 hypothetical protein [Clostridioides difficile]
MGRKITCRYCKEKFLAEDIYSVIHITKTGREEKRNYCCELHYRLEEREKWLWNQILLGIDSIIGYKCIAKNKTKMIKEMLDNGYTREDVYNCILEMKNQIIDALEFRKDIENEYQKLCYIFTILKNNIRDVTIVKKNIQRKEKKETEMDLVDIPEETMKIPVARKKRTTTLKDLIKEVGENGIRK